MVYRVFLLNFIQDLKIKVMTAVEILMLENQILLMESIRQMNELTFSKMAELEMQIKKSRELLQFYKK